MMLKIFLLLFLITNLFCCVKIGKKEKTTITSSAETGYIYIILSEFSTDDTIYLSFKVTNRELGSNIYIQYS